MFKRINESSPILARFLVFIAAPAGIAAVAAYAHLKQSVPADDGALAVAGIGAPVKVARGADAVPRIAAASDEDAYFSLGYLHARDRLWQMEYQKLIGQGRLSELRGAATLKLDFYIRTLGLRQAADRALAELAPRSRQLLDAYVKGVNARIGEGATLPPEYLVNNRRPEPWTAADSMLQLKLLQIGLDDRDVELLRRISLARQLGAGRANDLLAADGQQPVTVGPDFTAPDGNLVQTIDTAARRLQDEFGIGGGDAASSAWVVGGSLTASGKPILVNDLHTISMIPSKWYMSEMRGKEVHLAGATIPGLPLFFSGRNANISWGTTSLRALSPKLVSENVDPVDAGKYLVDGRWEQMGTRVETIHVKSAFPSYLRGEIKPLALTVRTTRRGPVISDLVESSGATYSIGLPGLQAQDKSFDALLALNFAQDWDQVKRGMQHHVSPAMNLVYADKAGNIASKVVGTLPAGSTFEVLDARMTRPEAARSAFDSLPEVFNPASGVIVRTAAAQAGGDETRAAHLGRMLVQKTAGSRGDVGAMLAMQADDLSIGAASLLPQLLALRPRDERQKLALDHLRTWDKRSRPDSVGASIYNAWVDRLFESLVHGRMINPDASRKTLASYPSEARVRFLAAVLKEQRADWCASGHGGASCHDRLGASLNRALDEMQLSFGKDMDDWKWGDIRKVVYRNPGIDPESLFSGFFARQAPGAGDNYSVNSGAPAVFSKDSGYQQFGGSSYLQVIDLSKENKSRFVTSTGASGNFLSASYDNFRGGASVASFQPVGFGEQHTGDRVLVLTPVSDKR